MTDPHCPHCAAPIPRAVARHVNELEDEKQKLRFLIAKYMATEGCSCCRADSHDEIGEEICILLDFPTYKDDSGYDYYTVAKQGLDSTGEVNSNE